MSETPKHLVRLAIGSERALSDSKTAMNMWVTAEEREFLSRLSGAFHVIGRHGLHDSYLPQLHVQDLPQ